MGRRRRRRNRDAEFDMAEIDRMVPVMKLDPARQPWLTVPGRSSCTCDCCNVTTKKKPSNKALIPAWLFRSDDDDDDHHEESAEEEEEDNLLQGLNKHLAEYRIGQYEIRNCRPASGATPRPFVLEGSSHRDGFFGLSWHSEYRMHETAPTSLPRSRFTTPHPRWDYEADNMLQLCSLSLAAAGAGDRRRLLVYGIVAARDDMEGLPNFVFNRTRDNAQEVTLSSPSLELSSPLRGISAFEHVLLEFDLKLKNTAGDGADADADDVLVDACIEFVDRTITCSAGRLLRSRIEGPICSLDMDYMFVKSGVEAAVEVFLGDSCASCFQSVAAVYRAIAGDSDGGGDGIVIHEESIPLPPKLMLAADTATAQAAAAATVVAVPTAGELTVTLSFATARRRTRTSPAPAPCLVARFRAQKVGSSEKGGEVRGAAGEVVPVRFKVTWSTACGFTMSTLQDYLAKSKSTRLSKAVRV
uniref:DUF6598 domain-containing protein n=1 Tax=Oryza glumipatula TaxID=40148 RepID=A0A0E0A0W4_9ORYZ